MDNSLPEETSFIELMCGCVIDDGSGLLSKECQPHKEGNFTQ